MKSRFIKTLARIDCISSTVNVLVVGPVLGLMLANVVCILFGISASFSDSRVLWILGGSIAVMTSLYAVVATVAGRILTSGVNTVAKMLKNGSTRGESE